MSISAGRLRHRVVIERLTASMDGGGEVIQDPATGEVVRTWQPVATVWAAIEPLSAREFLQSDAKQSQITTKIIMRKRADIYPSDRIKHGDRLYNPQAFLDDPDSGQEYMTAPCTVGTGEGQ